MIVEWGVDKVSIADLVTRLCAEEVDLAARLSAKREERIRIEHAAKQFVDAEAVRCRDPRSPEKERWILISGMAVATCVDPEALCRAASLRDVPLALYEPVATPAGIVRVYTPDRVDFEAALEAIGDPGASAEVESAEAVVVRSLKATVGEVNRRREALEQTRQAMKKDLRDGYDAVRASALGPVKGPDSASSTPLDLKGPVPDPIPRSR